MSNDGFPSTITQIGRQTAYQLRYFKRVPVAFFFTLVLPLVMLVLFNALFGGADIDTDEGTWTAGQFYTGGLAAFTAVSATYTNLANMVPIRRDEGVLKRWRGTPLPTWIHIAGFICSAVVIAAVGVVVMLVMGVLFYDLEVELEKMPAAVVTFLVGVASFAALGMAVAALIKTAASASAVANATILPLAFVSDVFVVVNEPPRWLEVLGNIFPLKPFANAFQDCFTPFVEGSAFSPGRLAFVAAWGVVGLVIAVTRFRWEPSGAAPRGRRSKADADA
ncbi:ABC transporter permease [Ilumatobacter coccineus]|jgi:ABC-2 type transport system permease protein|uniref:Transport permease protein n=1 Tax=Ilumatobacter coccineus (strain NBRC 103263 / KCTC 29153 / YM16-304) TaxID=1313172 RepID=A0A6C7ED80_ILUCY|nr:ABC transporter permease [Ilumatobacter coccineus]BAN03139.1 putative multidrug ABC transporter permease protein [Ilumatobacter coccineus YM16-304]